MRGKKANSSKRKRVHQDPKLQRRNCSEMKTEVIGSSNKKSLVTLAMYNPDSEWMPHYRKLGKWNWRWHSCSKYLKFWTCNFYSNAKVNYSVVSVLCDWIYTRAIISDEKKKIQVPIHSGSQRWKLEHRTGSTAYQTNQIFRPIDSAEICAYMFECVCTCIFLTRSLLKLKNICKNHHILSSGFNARALKRKYTFIRYVWIIPNERLLNIVKNNTLLRGKSKLNM